jgi:hypothetical protein
MGSETSPIYIHISFSYLYLNFDISRELRNKGRYRHATADLAEIRLLQSRSTDMPGDEARLPVVEQEHGGAGGISMQSAISHPTTMDDPGGARFAASHS